MATSGYKKSSDYPNEFFIQKAIEQYFERFGYIKQKVAYSDYVGINPSTNEKWVVEAKGETAAIGLDFRTCLGQVVQRIEESSTNYGVAVPYLKTYINQCNQVKSWVREVLNLHWIFVKEDGSIVIIKPIDEVNIEQEDFMYGKYMG